MIVGLGNSNTNFGTNTETGPRIISTIRTASTMSLRVNGAVYGTPVTPPAVGTVNLSYAFRSATYRSNGGLGEVVVCSPDDVELVEGILAWDWGMEGDLPSNHPYKLAPPKSTIAAVLDQIYDLQNYFLRSILDQPYGIRFARIAAFIDQIYGLKLLVTFNQFYGDAATLRGNLNQYYGDAARVRRHLEQKYGNTPKYRAAIDQIFHLYQGLRQQCHQDYSITEGQIRAALDQLSDLQDKDVLRATMDMLYVLAAGEALVQRMDVAVVCDGIEHRSIANINIEQDGNSFYMAGELLLYDQAEFLQYKKFVSLVDITVDGWTANLLCGIPRESRQPGMTNYVVPLASKTILLDAPHSRLDAAELSGMASQIVATTSALVSFCNACASAREEQEFSTTRVKRSLTSGTSSAIDRMPSESTRPAGVPCPQNHSTLARLRVTSSKNPWYVTTPKTGVTYNPERRMRCTSASTMSKSVRGATSRTLNSSTLPPFVN